MAGENPEKTKDFRLKEGSPSPTDDLAGSTDPHPSAAVVPPNRVRDIGKPFIKDFRQGEGIKDFTPRPTNTADVTYAEAVDAAPKASSALASVTSLPNDATSPTSTEVPPGPTVLANADKDSTKPKENENSTPVSLQRTKAGRNVPPAKA